MSEKKFMTVREVSEKLFLSQNTVRNKISNGDDMPVSFKLGSKRLFKVEDVENWIKKHTE